MLPEVPKLFIVNLNSTDAIYDSLSAVVAYLKLPGMYYLLYSSLQKGS